MTDQAQTQPQHAGVYVPPPLFYVIIFVVATLLDHLKPLAFAATVTSRVIGIALILGAVALAMWSIGLFWRQGTSMVPVKPSTAFVVDGPYRFSRNPMYMSMLIAYIGAALIAASFWPFLLLPVVIIVVDVFVIHREERYLSARFGEEYALYRSRVRRWI